MPYPAGHRERVRKRIVESARRLFNRSGFESVSVDSIMAHAGLTRGGFYSYFDSKSDLYAEVLSCFFTDPNWKSRWKGVEVDLASADAGPQIVRAYLSRQHFDDVENSCPMVALPSDVARGDERMKVAFETVFKAMVSLLGRDLRNRAQPPENTPGFGRLRFASLSNWAARTRRRHCHRVQSESASELDRRRRKRPSMNADKKQVAAVSKTSS